MAILIADTKLETETDAWYQFYVDKMSRGPAYKPIDGCIVQGEEACPSDEHCILH